MCEVVSMWSSMLEDKHKVMTCDMLWNNIIMWLDVWWLACHMDTECMISDMSYGHDIVRYK